MKKLTNCKNGGGYLLNKAFTLIELLAVIIILAIIALIATPIILNVIDEAKVSAGKSEANMILGGINNYCATEAVKEEMDENYTKKCTSEMNADTVKDMVNLGNATIDKIIYDGNKLTELEITSNSHKYKLCPSGTFVMDNEECDSIELTTGPIKDVVLSNFPYLATNGNGCVIPSENNYSYMGGCYLKGTGVSGKDIFYSMMTQMGMNNDTITQTFFDNEGNFINDIFENHMIPLYAESTGISEEELRQMLEQYNTTMFEMLFGSKPDELFLKEATISDNILWYSGFLWRIMGINADGTIRLITDENLTTISWGVENNAEKWDESYAKDWLNNYFYPKLKDNDIIVEQMLCSETTTNKNSSRTTCTNNLSKEPVKIGLITLDEYNLAGGENSYLNIGQYFWTMTPYSNSEEFFITYDGIVANSNLLSTYVLRAVISINSDIVITGGDGTLETTWNVKSGPYILNEDKNIEITGKLNEKATSGEYIMFSGKKYRIVDKDNSGNTKLILDSYYQEDKNIFKMKYNETQTNVFSITTGIGKKLNTDVLEWLVSSSDTANRNKLVIDYTWYQNDFEKGDNYKISLEETNPTRSTNATVGLIRIGEILACQNSSSLTNGYTTISDQHNVYWYWTITPSTTSNHAWLIDDSSYSQGYGVSNNNAIRPVIVIKSNTEIVGGTGTWSNPYQI